MKALICCLLAFCSFQVATAQQKSEEQLVNKILQCFANHDDSAYASLFPSFDTLWNIAQQYHDTDVISARRINNIRSNPQRLQQFDPKFNPRIIADFDTLYAKGRDSGIHWSDLLLARYDLEKAMLPRELIGFEKVVPFRLQGYIFVQDLLTRRIYCMAIKDVHGINGKWYGGHAVNILEAETIDEYYDKLAKERKVLKDMLLVQMYGDDTAGLAEDSAALRAKARLDAIAAARKAQKENEDEEEKSPVVTNEVVERKLYVGTFDKEVGLELYIRSLKGSCPETICGWDALYKFEDQDEWVRLEVTKGKNGKLLFSEDEAEMELTFKNGTAIGEWTSAKEKTTFEIQLTEKREVKNRKLFQLDQMLEDSE